MPSIKALVKLAESGQRLILHNRSNDVDTYMVNEEGTVYRYQVKPSKVVWGEWSEAATPVKSGLGPDRVGGSMPATSARSGVARSPRSYWWYMRASGWRQARPDAVGTVNYKVAGP